MGERWRSDRGEVEERYGRGGRRAKGLNNYTGVKSKQRATIEQNKKEN